MAGVRTAGGGSEPAASASCPSRPQSALDAPAGFFGLDSQAPEAEAAAEYAEMRCGGAGGVRLYVPWAVVNPAPGVYRWEDLDRRVGRAAGAGLDPLLFVYLTPAWAVGPGRVAASEAEATRLGRTLPGNGARLSAWRDFLRRLVERYGPEGSLWDSSPRGDAGHPVRDWELWNEPNLRRFARPAPDPAAYGRLLVAGYKAIHAADAGAMVLSAGLNSAHAASGRRIDFAVFIERMLAEVPASAGSFDALALHPYAGSAEAVAHHLDRARRALDAGGLGERPIWVTEVGWSSRPPCRHRPTAPATPAPGLRGCTPSSRPLFKGVAGQAAVLGETMRALAAARQSWRLERAFVYAWRDLPPESWSEPCRYCVDAGLVSWRTDPEGAPLPKPAWRQFARLAP